MKIDKHLVVMALLLAPRFLTAEDRLQVESNGVVIVTVGGKKDIDEMAVYPQGGIAGRPLLIAAHGNGGSGPREIEGYLDLAKQHNFTIVCPTFLSSVYSMHIPDDRPYFKESLQWIEGNVRYDKRNVYMTGFSGGGYAVWHLATARPDFFKGLFLQSGNFDGSQYYDLNLASWHNKPIRLIWGAEDSPSIIAQNQQAVEALQTEHCINFSTETIPGAHHQPHHDLVVSWMERQVGADSANP